MKISEAIAMLEENGIERASDNVEHYFQRISSLANCEIGDELTYLYKNVWW